MKYTEMPKSEQPRNRISELGAQALSNAEVFRSAVRENAPAVVIVHNHPSGDPTPSPEDVGLTRAIAEAGELMDIEVLDHLVIGKGRHVSMKERRLGF
jgi:DNA repair protein RadC